MGEEEIYRQVLLPTHLEARPKFDLLETVFGTWLPQAPGNRFQPHSRPAGNWKLLHVRLL